MKPETLTLRGILAFPEERTLDYRQLPPGGLIAFTGLNGVGKTTLMECPIAAEYRVFPSREKELYDYATRTDAFIEHTFELEGRGLYRARLNIDGPHRKAEAVLSQIDADGRITFLNDGKLSTFDAKVKEILPRLDDLLASVFASQSRKRSGSFSDLEKKDRRVLFASLLGLDHYQHMSERAGQAVARLEREIEVLIARREALARSANDAIESSIERRSQQLQIDAGSVDVEREDLTRKVADAEAALALVQDAIERHATTVALVAKFEAEQRAKTAERERAAGDLVRLTAEHDAETRRLVDALAAATARFEKAKADTSEYDREIIAIAARAARVVDEAEKRIEANREELLDQEGAIEAAVASLVVIDAALDENDRGSRENLALLTGHQKRERVLLEALSVIELKEAQLARAERDAGAIAGAPFAEKCEPCAFMTNAATAKAQIPGLREAVAAKPAAEAELESVRGWVTAAEGINQRLAEARATLQKDRAAKKPIADKAAPLALAEARIGQREREIVAARETADRERVEAAARREERSARLTREHENRQLEFDGEITVLNARIDRRRTELREQADTVGAVLEDLGQRLQEARGDVSRHAEAAGRAAEQQALLSAYRRQWDETTATKARVGAEMASLDRDRATYTAAKLDLDAVHARVEALQGDVVEWGLLAKSLGREGIQALEIDNAGPTVSAFANDLSEHCAGGRFTFELVTQALKVNRGKDGSTHREVFEINVYDQKNGGARRDISDLSGGERIIAEEILRSAIALLVNARSAFPLRACWRDETTGALDAENAERYMAMLRRVQQIGGFTYLFFVTHSEDCKRLADAQVQVADGDFSIALPPYAVVPDEGWDGPVFSETPEQVEARLLMVAQVAVRR